MIFKTGFFIVQNQDTLTKTSEVFKGLRVEDLNNIVFSLYHLSSEIFSDNEEFKALVQKSNSSLQIIF